ncbi:bifunctional 4-hydroxy-2-oxoglutarate aldolase/2-dehydro-3-deoxy-phosphogluconate aldolase [Helicobacter ailurogastricus]|uniref:2-dehydro-3-deoxy-phosphogluconate aldolase n=1 Tax=Helicobacter ailurogastricus TaxID=1578720 RepID=A0A0K2XEH1_9HELI|nr:bifunctional 4-hydroxy-2-oxoglutarate aldolase/2-dehydro-3-deoxy-phosphogluconate aldolase [Helicobacter ailurogastricus]GMB91755.1 2-keto-3-deoxy-6-phosphogluconate aldolase [Helicobacter ailurogastricus]CRF40818.1 4-hydroxy-2-oxoglutarate aldolase @ 2-dehydro-3-deoxyphosphogluconate aldolase [Helicobacter ailurogastricus]CRF43289.1 4-hydroxy-2-oxoglutarate aldolase @ 2-dehydro-3-deoxyphosphogluconate aldolase [Helicobacter ailurogastricus]CRF44481.1 4-hydroxy-2-oxoglutarate aldolase @ 2-de
MQSLDILNAGRIIPVMVVEEAQNAVPLARALVQGGIKVLEITLRTKEALEAIKQISQEVPEAIVGAGTVLNAIDFKKAQVAGAKFAISPGLIPALAQMSKDSPIPLIPGVASASEVMLALEFGLKSLKFFPAQAAGGVATLKSFAGPFKEVFFCPTGGISLENMGAYLKLDNVLCVGGSWLAPKELVQAKEWPKITAIAQRSVAVAQDI